MRDENAHPIENGKGAAAILFCLAAIGVFFPFPTEIFFAQIFATFAILLILWLYWSDFGPNKLKILGISHFLPPLISVFAIVSVAGIATMASRSKTNNTSSSISPGDVAAIVDRTSPSPQPKVAPTPQRERIVIVERPYKENELNSNKTSQNENVHSPEKNLVKSEDGVNQEYKNILTRAQIGEKAYSQCFRNQLDVSAGLTKLDWDGYKIQNNWAYSRNSKDLQSSYEIWNGEVKSFFEKYKSELPDYSIVELANYDSESKTFLGTGGDSQKTMGRIDAKRGVIQSIGKDFSRKDCEIVRKSAIFDCIQKRQC